MTQLALFVAAANLSEAGLGPIGPTAPTLAGELCDRRRIAPGDGSARLLRALVVAGLRREALPAAAGLVLALDAEAYMEATAA